MLSFRRGTDRTCTRMFSRSSRPTPRTKHRRFLRVEPLEERVVLSTYWVSPSGNDSNAGSASSPFATLQHSMMSLKPGDTLDVEPGTYTGFIAGWDSTPASSGDPYGTIDGTAGHPITIQADPNAAPGSVVINSRDNETAVGIDLEPGCDYVTIKGFTVDGTGSTITTSSNKGYGIKVTGNNDQVIGNTVKNMIGACIAGIHDDGGNNAIIQGNTITGVQSGGDATKGHGIYVADAAGVQVLGNIIHDNAYIGIHINGDPNTVSNAMIAGNVIYNNGQNAINADGLQSSIIENNLIYNYAGYGICLYYGDSSGPSSNNIIVNNTIYSGTSTGTGGSIRILDASTGNTILNNILLDSSAVVYRISADSQSGTVSNYNIVPNGAQVQSEDTGRNESFSQWQSSTGQDHNSLAATAAQLFVNPSANNYQELSTSPSIGAGTSTDAPSRDILGNPRPNSNGYDIGCYEYETSTPSAPAVTSLSPTSGPAAGGTLVTIIGTGFTGAPVVDFGTTAATGVTVVNSSKITAVSPAGTGVVDVTVTTSGGTSAASTADQFTYIAAAPTVTSLSPTSGPAAGGTLVTITGTGFTGAPVVDFGTTAATGVTVVNSSKITAVSPAGTGVVDVTVTTSGGTSATSTADQFTYIAAAPTVTSLSPTSGPAAGGTLVTITGTGFTGAPVVDFGTTAATGVTVVNSSKITAVSPAGTGVVDVTVTTPGGTSATSTADQFTYIAAAPTVTSLSPTSGPAAGGTSVTITGTGFTGAQWSTSARRRRRASRWSTAQDHGR